MNVNEGVLHLDILFFSVHLLGRISSMYSKLKVTTFKLCKITIIGHYIYRVCLTAACWL